MTSCLIDLTPEIPTLVNKTMDIEWIELPQINASTLLLNESIQQTPDIEQILELYYDNISSSLPFKYGHSSPAELNNTQIYNPELPSPIKYSYYNNQRVGNDKMNESDLNESLSSREIERFRDLEVREATDWGLEMMDKFYEKLEFELYKMGMFDAYSEGVGS